MLKNERLAMKLILSSQDFTNPNSAEFINKNLDKSLKECRVLFFPNEKGLEMSIRRSKYQKRLEGYGFERRNVIVFDYDHPELFKDLEIDIIYVGGGNTFGTLKRIRDAGFDGEIVKYVKNGVVYIGGSAGAHIACKDISHVERYDENRWGVRDYSGLGLYDGIFVCHFSDERKAHFEELREEGKNVIALSDDDSLLVVED